MNNALEKEKEDKFTISVTQPADFPSLLKGAVITSKELMDKVSELFSAAYKDFMGCYLTPRPNGMGFDIKLYFALPVSVDNEGASYAFDLLSSPSPKKGIFGTLQSIEKRTSQRIYTITQHGREGLEDFLLIAPGRKPDWKQYLFEETQQSNINGGVYAVVTNLDINKILAAIYGQKENDEYLQYLLTPIRPLYPNQAYQASPLGMNQAQVSGDWLLSLQRMSMKELNNLSRKVGISQTNGIPMNGRK
jgi:hypothetical protein